MGLDMYLHESRSWAYYDYAKKDRPAEYEAAKTIVLTTIETVPDMVKVGKQYTQAEGWTQLLEKGGRSSSIPPWPRRSSP